MCLGDLDEMTARRGDDVAERRALVIGAGVSGLSCALRLQAVGFVVEIWTRDLPEQTTSAVAGAIWYPFKIGPADRVAEWARVTYRELVRLADVPGSGVVLRRGVELLPPGVTDESAAYREGARGLRPLAPSELPAGFDRGFELEVPVVEMPVYLAHLRATFEERGGRLQVRTVDDFAEALRACPLVVNTTGLGARELTGDRELQPIRGQVVRVDRMGIDRFVLNDYDPAGVTYVVPRSEDCVLGGTSDAGDESLVPDDEATRAIRERCASLEPRLREAPLRSVGVALRPGRPAVRLEREPREDGVVIHDYGHGGAGVTVSWGCAEEAAHLACHVPLADLDAGLPHLAPPPTDVGWLELIVRRLSDGSRETPARVHLGLDTGVPGDDWAHRPPRDPEAQLAVMRADVATLVAGGQPLTTFGDNLFVDLDISRDNLPAGTTLRVGEAVVEVTPLPHDGCRKFRARFGGDALRFVAAKPTRAMNLRGVYWKVVRAGDIAVGDAIRVLTRASPRRSAS